MPRRVSPPVDGSLLTWVGQRVLRLGDTSAQCADSGEYPVAGVPSPSAYRARWRDGESPCLGRASLGWRAVWTSPHRALDAPSGVARPAPAATLAAEGDGHASGGDAEPLGTGLHGHGAQHQMGDRHHLHSHGRALAVSVCGVGFVFRARRGLVDESAAGTPVILHSDRGCQFTSAEYQRFLAAHPLTGSMSAVGNCADNAAAESFFGVLKRERVNRRQYRTRAEARTDIFDYIERGHNPRQRRRLAFQPQAAKLLTQVSVETG